MIAFQGFTETVNTILSSMPGRNLPNHACSCECWSDSVVHDSIWHREENAAAFLLVL